MATPRPRLILHAGLPKTGTSALQAALLGASDALQQTGAWYPPVFPSPTETFHRFLIEDLRRGPELPRLAEVLTEARHRGVSRLILSIEGVTLHRDAIRPEAAAAFAALTRDWDVEIVVVLRAAPAWLLSLYRQCVISHPIRRRPSAIETLYATGLSHHDFVARDHVRRICDREAILADFRTLFRDARLSFLSYEDGFVEAFAVRAGLERVLSTRTTPRINTSLPDPDLEVLRQVNGRAPSLPVHALIRAISSAEAGGANVHLALHAERLRSGLRQRAAAAALLGHLLRLRYRENPPLAVDAQSFAAARHRIARRALTTLSGSTPDRRHPDMAGPAR